MRNPCLEFHEANREFQAYIKTKEEKLPDIRTGHTVWESFQMSQYIQDCPHFA